MQTVVIIMRVST